MNANNLRLALLFILVISAAQAGVSWISSVESAAQENSHLLLQEAK